MSKKTYGIASRGPNKGKLTPCNAKDPEKCSFHVSGSHRTMDEEELQSQAENIAKTDTSTENNTTLRRSKETGRSKTGDAMPRVRRSAFSGSITDFNSMIDKDELTEDDLDAIHDKYFDGIRPLAGWKNNDNVYAFKVAQSRQDPSIAADEYNTTFSKEDSNELMHLTVQKDTLGNPLSSIMQISDGVTKFTVDIPANRSNKRGFDAVWGVMDREKLPENVVRRDMVVIPGGRLAGLDTPLKANGKLGRPVPVMFSTSISDDDSRES